MSSINKLRTDNYLRFLPLFFGVSLLLALLIPKFIYQSETNPSNKDAILLFNFVGYAICQSIFWMVIGKATQSTKAALLTLLGTIILMACKFTLSFLDKEDKPIGIGLSSVFMIAHLMVFFFFAFQTLPKGRYIEMALLAITASYLPISFSHINIISQLLNGMTMTYSSAPSIVEIKIPLYNGMYFLINGVDVFYDVFISVGKLVILTAFVEQSQKFDFRFSDKFLNLNNTYSKKQATLIFITLKILILCLPFFIIGFHGHEMRRYDAYYGYSSAIVPIIIFIFQLVVMYSVLQAYRRFVLEFLYSKGSAPSFAYWFFLIPIIGTIVFLFVAFDEKPSLNAEERVATFLNSTNTNSSNTIANIITSLQFMSFILLIIAKGSGFSIVMSFCMLMLFVIFSKMESTIYMFIGLFLLLFVYTFFNYQGEYGEMLLKTFYQITILYILSGIFHINSFEYLPNLNEMEEETT